MDKQSSFDPQQLPRHIAIVMDGNGRWAESRMHRRIFGHIRGATRIRPIVEEASRLGVSALTFFAFSTENWNRPEAEREVLWKLLKKFLKKEEETLKKNNICFRVLGEIDRLGGDVRSVLAPAMHRLSKNTGLKLNFAVSYGSRRELARAARLFAEDCLKGKAHPSDMTEAFFSKYLWTADLNELSDVDLVVRTSGEKRVSNFLLWQAAYAEYVFQDLSWPEFQPCHLRGAIEEYMRRDRRFGEVKRQETPKSIVSDSPSLE